MWDNSQQAEVHRRWNQLGGDDENTVCALAPHALTLTIDPSSEEESMSSGWPFSFSRSSCPAGAYDKEKIVSMG